MRVTGIKSCARRDGHAAILVRRFWAEVEEEGVEPEKIQLTGKKINVEDYPNGK